jgi:Sensors of blue-light using FAD
LQHSFSGVKIAVFSRNHWRALFLAHRSSPTLQPIIFSKDKPMSATPQPRSFHGDEPMSGHTHPLLYNMVYCSRATPGIDADAVDRIIATSRRHNPARGITGLLVFGSGVFFQWLEGPRDNLLELMAAIKTDSRHENVVSLSTTEEVRERLFPDWDMELVTADDIRDVLLDAMGEAKDAQNAEALRLLIAQLDSGKLNGLGGLEGLGKP